MAKTHLMFSKQILFNLNKLYNYEGIGDVSQDKVFHLRNVMSHRH